MFTSNQDVDAMKSNATLLPNRYFITRGQYIIYEFVIKTKIVYSSSFTGLLGFKADYNATTIEIEEKVLAPMPNTSYTVLELRWQPDYLIYEEQKYQNTSNIKN